MALWGRELLGHRLAQTKDFAVVDPLVAMEMGALALLVVNSSTFHTQPYFAPIVGLFYLLYQLDL
jgi:hypothetical protein